MLLFKPCKIGRNIRQSTGSLEGKLEAEILLMFAKNVDTNLDRENENKVAKICRILTFDDSACACLEQVASLRSARQAHALRKKKLVESH